MDSDVPEVRGTQLHLSSVKVHLALCTQLLRLVDKISSILPAIEAARPRCSGMEALSLLQTAIEKAKLLVQNCHDSSKLYLALTKDAIVSRFEHTRNHLQQNLRQLQTMVPVALEFEISEILDNLRDAEFILDTREDEAGKALLALLHQDASSLIKFGDSEIEVLQFAASRLHLTSQKGLVAERRSIRKLLDEVKGGNPTKTATLRYMLYLLKKYDKQLVQEQPRLPSAQNEGLFEKFKNTYLIPDYHLPHVPPEEFICPLSSRLMHDPVIISSGQTFERSAIQKWFEKGHDICPRTRLKLFDLSVLPNTALRDLILKWSTEHGIVVSDYLEASSNSISSTASSLKDTHLGLDMNTKSFGSLHSNYSDFQQAELEDGFSSIREIDDNSHSFQFFYSIDDIRTQLLSDISGLPWESQCRAVQDVNYYLIFYNPSCAFVSSENFLEPLIHFLKDALDKHDVEAQKAGTQLFLTFLRASRSETAHISDDVYTLLAAFLETEAAADSLAIMEVLSTQVRAFPVLAESNALTSIIKLLDSPNSEFQQAAFRILYNSSMNINTSRCKLASDWIPYLVPFLGNRQVASTCLGILGNLCNFEEARVSIAETDGCIASIIELLDEIDSSEEQELGVGILLSLCAESDDYCHLVLHEGVVPALCHVSVNGSEKARVSASELLRILRDVKYDDGEDYTRSNALASDHELTENFNDMNSKSLRMPGSFRRKMKTFLKKKLMLSAH